jgi:WD40 repeat protein
MWDVERRREETTFEIHEDRVWGLEFTPNGERIVTASEDRTVRAFPVRGGTKARARKENVGHTPGTIVFSPDRRVLLLLDFSQQAVTLWDVPKGAIGGSFPLGSPAPSPVLGSQACAFSPDGSRLAVATSHGLKLFSCDTFGEITVLRGHSGLVSACAFFPNGEKLVSLSNDGTIRIWSTRSASALATAPLRGEQDAYEILPLITDFLTETEVVWSTACRISPDGLRILARGARNELRMWLDPELKQVRGLGQVNGDECFDLSSDGELVLSATDTFLRLWDGVTGAELARFSTGLDRLTHCEFSPSGRQALSQDSKGILRVSELASGSEMSSRRCRRNGLSGVSQRPAAFSPSGRYVASFSEHSTLEIWDVFSNETMCEYWLSRANLAVEWTPDESKVIAVEEAGGVHLLQVENLTLSLGTTPPAAG